MAAARRRGDHRRMKNSSSHRLPLLLTLSLTVAAMFALTASTPAFAACTPGAADKPDLGFVDSNCDGIDGDKAAAIFVAPGGNDANDGSFGHPKATVAAGATAGLAAHKDVYVASGTYDGKVSILGSTGDIGIYGGYDPSTWARSAANLTTLEAPAQVVTVAVPGIVLQLLTIKGQFSGSTSYGVRAWNHGEFALSRVTVEPAAGGNGSSGANAPQSPPEAAPNGKQAVGSPNCDPGALSGTFNPGAKGGEAAGLLSGGTGGDWFKPYPFSGTNGQSDPENPSVGGGIGGEKYWPGGLGSPGLPGAPGLPGLDSLNRAALIYAPMPGTDGGSGTRGAGGGGGGMSENTCMPGSGGGAGGRPGAGGKGGSGGGGSIGVYVGEGAHALVLDGSVIHAADGGKGGNGGLGQPGGEGGEGGLPGARNLRFRMGSPAPPAAMAARAAPAARAVAAPAAHRSASSRRRPRRRRGGHDDHGRQGRLRRPGRPHGLAGCMPSHRHRSRPSNGILPAGRRLRRRRHRRRRSMPARSRPAPAPAARPTGPRRGRRLRERPGGRSGVSRRRRFNVLPGAACLPKAPFKIKLSPGKSHMKSARLTLDGHKLKLVKGKRTWTAKVDLRRSNRASHTLTIRGRLKDGRSFRQTRHYRTCAR